MRCFFTITLILGFAASFASPRKLVLLRPTGQKIDSLVAMEEISDTSQLAIRILEIVEKSVIKDFLDIHRILQVYLFNSTGKPIEPAYLALTQNQGGYARKGFVLVDGDQLVRKPNSFYVDIHENTSNKAFNSLMSITQLYPHELGHIMYRLLSSSDSIEEDSKNINVHFFSLTTDYQIAFNEGFAEHLENIARLFEKDQELIEGIRADTSRIAEKSKVTIKGFNKDFKYPFRFGFYKMTMLIWYQPFEDYKRFSYSINGFSKFRNASLISTDRQNSLIYRNTGVGFNPNELRNKVQLQATEGCISTFFTMLSQTNIKDQYQPDSFYYAFQMDTSEATTAEEQFTPLQNLFIKYFYILDKYVILEKSNKSQLIDFIDGYLIEFPEEGELIRNTYWKTTGMDYDNTLPPQIWLLLKGQDHGILAMDAYAGLSLPVYTFEINAAGFEDLMMIKELKEADARAILDDRRENGLFTNIQEMMKVGGLSEAGRRAILSKEFDRQYFENLEFPEDLNIKSVIMAPIRHLIFYTSIYFGILMVIYFAGIWREKLTIIKALKLLSGYLLLWILFVLLGLIIAGLGWDWSIILTLTLVALLFSLLQRGARKRRSITMISLMTLIILASII
jgi:Helix-hairpin-helix motif